MGGPRLTVTEYSRYRGVDPASVSQALEDQRIVLGPDGMLDAFESDRLWEATTRKRQPGVHIRAKKHKGKRAPDPPSPFATTTTAEIPQLPQSDATSEPAESYQASRARREAAEADLAELKLKELEGQLMRTADARNEWAKRCAGLREGLLQLPARLAAVLAAEPDQAKVHDVLRLEIHAALSALVE
jgi:hypothetical protein